MLNTSFTPWPMFDKDEADAVRKVVLSNKVNYWTGQSVVVPERIALCDTKSQLHLLTEHLL